MGGVFYVYMYMVCSAVHKLQSFSHMYGLKILVGTSVVWQHQGEHDIEKPDGRQLLPAGRGG